MLTIPPALLSKYAERLRASSIPISLHGPYQKWLRYYLDFCGTYRFPPHHLSSLPLFLQKLQDKRQPGTQQEQAAAAITLYYDILKEAGKLGQALLSQPHDPGEGPSSSGQKGLSAAESPIGPVQFKALPSPALNRTVSKSETDSVPKMFDFSPELTSIPEVLPAEQGKGASWVSEYTRLTAEICLRHYSSKTLVTYRGWVRQLQAFTRSKAPAELSTDDVRAFMTFLAVERNVSAATQNQAFNSLLFFYRHVLGKEFGRVDGVVRAKRKPCIPVVLSREEIDAVLAQLEPPYDLIVKLLYGCGLRLFECLELRVQCLNFDEGLVTVNDGKGQKDRSIPLPRTIIPELLVHLESLKTLHQRDLERRYAGVFLVNALEQKYNNAAREFVWQWFFPAIQLTRNPETGEYRRYHLHETNVQKAIRQAVSASRICKRVSAHTFRHSFASHLLRGNYDIRTVQELLGHSDVRTTMIYTHTVKSVTIKEPKSPLDL